MRMPSHSERNAGRYCLVDLVHLGAAVDTEVKPTWSRGTGVELRVDVLDVRATDDTDVDTQPDERLDLFPHRRRVRVAVGDCGAVPIEGDGLEAASQRRWPGVRVHQPIRASAARPAACAWGARGRWHRADAATGPRCGPSGSFRACHGAPRLPR